MGQKFVVENGKTLNELVKSRNAVLLYQDSINKATFYKLDDSRIVVYPAVGSKGVIINSEKDISEVFKNGFPIEEEAPNHFQIERSKLIDIEKNIEFYLDELGKGLAIKVQLENDSASYYNEISHAINKMGYKNFYNSYFIHFGIFIGEKVRKLKGGHWELEKRYGYNPYYEPYVRTNNQVIVNPWYKMADILLKRKSFDLSYYFSLILSTCD